MEQQHVITLHKNAIEKTNANWRSHIATTRFHLAGVDLGCDICLGYQLAIEIKEIEIRRIENEIEAAAEHAN